MPRAARSGVAGNQLQEERFESLQVAAGEVNFLFYTDMPRGLNQGRADRH